MTTMQALVKMAADHTELRQIPVPEPGDDQVLVRVKAAALCGTDMHIYKWSAWAQNAGISLPLVMGHECCGDVVAVGENVTNVQVGDKVAAETHIPCGKCFQCMNKEPHICADLAIFGVSMDGCFSEYAVIPAAGARKIPKGIGYEIGAIMEPLGTAFRAVNDIRVGGANVVILGCGPVGLFAIASSAALGAAKVIASDISPRRLGIASKMGADLTVDPLSEDIIRIVKEETKGVGADIVIDASGSVEAIQESFDFLRKGGRVALIGLPNKPAKLDLGKDIIFKEVKIIGIHGRKIFETSTGMENMLAAGKLDPSMAITHILPLTEWEKGIDLVSCGEACKVVFKP